jgi:hypothetical protein
MNTRYLKWFSIVVWLGVPVNLYFAVPALFFPGYVVDTLDLEPGFFTVWLRNAGLLIFIITAYQILAAVAPSRYRAVAWMTIGGRLAAAIYWLVVSLDWLGTSNNPSGFLPFLIGDVLFGGVSGVLLYLGLRAEAAARQRQPAGAPA